MNRAERRPVILAVDDEPENLDLVERALGLDYEVHRAANGEEALAILSRLEELHVIITDQRMPVMSGTQLLKVAKVRRPEAVRIIVTGYTSPSDLIDAINSSSVFRFLTKPWNVDHFVEVVKRAVRLSESGGDLLDEATGLPGRAWMRRELERDLARAADGAELAVHLVRISGYRELLTATDRGGAEPLIGAVADALRRTVAPTEVVGVYGPGEFLVLSPSTGSPSVDQLTQAVRACPELRGAKNLEVVARTANHPDDGLNAPEILATLGLA